MHRCSLLMNPESSKVELGIVAAKDVQRYAEESLPDAKRPAIERALLDDDRARQLVIKNAGNDDVPPPSAATAQKLALSVNACQQCIMEYEIMKSGDGFGPLLDLVADRFVKRWSLLKRVLQSLDESADELADFQKPADTPSEISSDAPERVIQQDSILSRTLQEAFDAASTPIWKARIADWIAAIDDDIFRLMRLKRVYF